MSDTPKSPAQADPVQQKRRGIAIACQGGGAQAAYAAGAAGVLLERLLAAGPDGEPLRWLGISGTSGGALSALVAWYGALFRSPEAARTSLRQLWQENSAQRPGEVWWNALGVWTLDSFPFDIQLNPYMAPLKQLNQGLTRVWPLAAGFAQPLAASIRPDYFRIDALAARFVDFGQIAALGQFLSVADTIGAWQALGYRDEVLQGHGLQEDGTPLPPRQGLPATLSCYLTARKVLAEVAARHPKGLLAQALAQHWTPAVERDVAEIERLADQQKREFDEEELELIRIHVAALRDALPLLLLGAADVGTGEFVAFNSRRAPERRGISLEAVRASAAVPWVFQGVEIPDADPPHESHVYWDGLFSQNPPIADFFAGVDPEDKPDEIWIVQVNPQRCDTKDLDKRLWDRRNELSGNISLNQEVASAAAVNARIDGDGSGGDKRVQILRVAMDSRRIERELGRPLGPSSKLDRSVALMDALFEHGQEQARAFLPVRDLLEGSWNRPGSATQLPTPIGGLPADGIEGLRRTFGEELRFQVADMTIEKLERSEKPEERQRVPGGEPFEDEALRARISWYCNVRGDGGRRGRLQGIAVLALDSSDRVIGARMTNIALSRPDIAASRHAAVRTLPRTVA